MRRSRPDARDAVTAATVRAIDRSDMPWWGALGDDDVGETARSLEADGSSGPDRWFVAERDGVPVGRLGLLVEDAGGGSDRREHSVFGLWLGDDEAGDSQRVDAALIRAAVATLPPGLQTIDLRTVPGQHPEVERRRAMLASVGGRLFQEKVGLTWDDPGDDRPDPGRLRFRTVADVGREVYGGVMGACQVGTLDRNDRYYLGLCGPAGWGREMLGLLHDGDEASWLLAEEGSGAPVGFVAVGRFRDEGIGTIVHIGVLPEHRGHGYVADLLAAAQGIARRRGFGGLFDGVDAENGPMLAAMDRAGYRVAPGSWHQWHDRASVVIAADGTPLTLRDVEITDRAALMALRRGPGQDRYLGSMESHFEDAIEDARAEPRMWALHAGDTVVGFVMISDGIPQERLDADDDIVGPYFLWRLLVDAGYQGRGYGAAAIDLVVDYLASRPGAAVLLTSCKAGAGSPQPFYLHYGFTHTGIVKWGEDLLSLDLAHRPEDR